MQGADGISCLKNIYLKHNTYTKVIHIRSDQLLTLALLADKEETEQEQYPL